MEQRVYSSKSDVWSFGVVGKEVLIRCANIFQLGRCLQEVNYPTVIKTIYLWLCPSFEANDWRSLTTVTRNWVRKKNRSRTYLYLLKHIWSSCAGIRTQIDDQLSQISADLSRKSLDHLLWSKTNVCICNQGKMNWCISSISIRLRYLFILHSISNIFRGNAADASCIQPDRVHVDPSIGSSRGSIPCLSWLKRGLS